MKEKINFKLVNLLLLCLLLFFIVEIKDFLYTIYLFLKKILTPFFIAFLLAYFINPLLLLFKKKFSHNLSFVLTILTVILVLFLILFLSLPMIIKESGNVIKIVFSFIETYVLSNESLNYEILLRLEDFLNHSSNDIYRISVDVVSFFMNFFTNFFLVIILFFSFLYNFEKIKIYFLTFIKNIDVKNLILNVDNEILMYIKSILIIVVVETFEYSLIYFFIGHPNFLLIGILAGVSTVIPFFGGVLTNVLALITAFSYSKELFLLTSLILIFVPLIDNYIIGPRIYKNTIKINPLKSMITMIIASFLFGLFGIILAVPIYILINNVISFIYQKREVKQV